MRPDRTPGSLVLPVLLVAAAIFAVVTLLSDDSTVRPLDISVAEVTADPAAYEGRQVVLRGSVAEIPERIPAGSEGAFVMTDAGGGRLLVIPGRPAQVDALEAGGTAHVSGVVRPPDTAADERRPEDQPLTRADLLGATGSDAILEAGEVAPA